jgi:hypothetical protein
MSKLVRESVEKAERLLAKKGDLIDGELKAELAKHLELAQTLSGDYRSLKEEIKEKRLDIEENARALVRATRKAKKAAADQAEEQGASARKGAAAAPADQASAPRAAKKAKD